jgi:hypothetical protein
MSDNTGANLERRAFLRDVCAAAAVSSFFGFGLHGAAAASAAHSPQPEDAPATHNMLVVGEKAVYLSHLPMFRRLDDTKTSYVTPHRYQVLLEATFNSGDKDLSSLYMEDRAKNSGVKIYTMGPNADFVLPQVGASAGTPLRSFTGTIFRGHLENGGQAVNKLEDITINVKRVIHFRQFNPRDTKPTQLEYLLFGRPDELFLSHFISKPPDFDQVMSVKSLGPGGSSSRVTEEALSQGIRLTLNRPNTAHDRVKENQKVSAQLLIGGQKPEQPLSLDLTTGREFYFEEGELRMPASFDTTQEEKAAGFV